MLVSAIAAATAGALAGPLAIFLVGGQFAGLHGAALVSACLAFLGGGAIAAGGLGMAGGVMVIVGGGAVLGAAAGGAALGGIEAIVGSSPAFALTSAAKLDVVLREIILNHQHDAKYAQAILENYKRTISELAAKIKSLELASQKDKEQIKNLKKSVEYMENILKDMNKFASSFAVGL